MKSVDASQALVPPCRAPEEEDALVGLHDAMAVDAHLARPDCQQGVVPGVGLEMIRSLSVKFHAFAREWVDQLLVFFNRKTE